LTFIGLLHGEYLALLAVSTSSCDVRVTLYDAVMNEKNNYSRDRR